MATAQAVPHELPSRWHASPYLLSAACVLLGGALLVREADGLPRLADLEHVLATQVAYSACLLALGAWLVRARRNVRDGLLLLALLTVFSLDALGIQHLYGWSSPDGVRAAWIGGLSGAILLGCAALVLGRPPWSALALSAMGSVIFVRFGGFLLARAEPASADTTFSPHFVALSWLLVVVFLPMLLLPRSSERAASDRRLEAIALAACCVACVAHFSVLGASFALPFRMAYLAPLVVVLPAIVEHHVARARSERWARLLLDLLPLAALASTATLFSPSLVDRPWAHHVPLTPYSLALVGAAATATLRAVRGRSVHLAHQAAALLGLAVLGGDMPEMLARLRFPEWWQALLVAGICWTTILVTRRFLPGVLLHSLAAFTLASLVAETTRIPWIGAFVVLVALGVLAIAHVVGSTLSLRERLAAHAVAVVAPLACLSAADDPLPRLAFAAFVLVLMVALAAWTRDVLARAAVPALALGVGAVEMLAVQTHGEISPGRLFIELGFVLLLAGALHSMLGRRLAGGVVGWWRELA